MKDLELEKFLKEMRKETLSSDEKVSLWSSIRTHITHTPLSVQNNPYHFMIKKRFIPILISLFLLVGITGGTVALANGAAPGDFLYPVDRAAENVRLALSKGERQDALRIAFSVERVEEAERILTVNNVSLTQINATTSVATTTPSMEAAKKGLEIALAYIEENKQKFEDEGNTNAVATLTVVAQRLSDIADNHLAELEKLTVKINTDDGKNKAEVRAISDTLKTKFKIEEKKNGNVTIQFSTSTSKKDSDDKKNDNHGKKDDKGKKDDDDRDDDRKENDKKVTICHNRKETISVSSNALWSHIKHGDSKGSCSNNNHQNNIPVFSSVSSMTQKTTAKIMWRTNVDTTGTVWYATAPSVLVSTSTPHVDDTKKDNSHNVMLTNLTPDTLYYYVITAKDKNGNTATSSERSFRTEKEDDIKPIISNVSHSTGITTGTVTWNTNENTTGIVYIGTSSPLTIGNSTKSGSDGSTGAAHSVSFSGLLEDTTYHFFIVAKDSFGNTATSSTMTFHTDSPADTVAPVISSLTTSDIGSTTAKITFTSSEGATSKLWIATSSPVSTDGVANHNIATFITGHTYNLSGLSASTTYRCVVTATDNAGNTATSSERSFTTPD